MVISDLNRLSATEPFPSSGFQIINEVSPEGRFTMPLNQNKRISHHWSWDVSTTFAKSIRFCIPLMECSRPYSEPAAFNSKVATQGGRSTWLMHAGTACRAAARSR